MIKIIRKKNLLELNEASYAWMEAFVDLSSDAGS